MLGLQFIQLNFKFNLKQQSIFHKMVLRWNQNSSLIENFFNFFNLPGTFYPVMNLKILTWYFKLRPREFRRRAIRRRAFRRTGFRRRDWQSWIIYIDIWLSFHFVYIFIIHYTFCNINVHVCTCILYSTKYN
jgi:hypothetical protein